MGTATQNNIKSVYHNTITLFHWRTHSWKPGRWTPFIQHTGKTRVTDSTRQHQTEGDWWFILTDEWQQRVGTAYPASANKLPRKKGPIAWYLVWAAKGVGWAMPRSCSHRQGALDGAPIGSGLKICKLLGSETRHPVGAH
jgi:hypothetical protein